MISPERGCWRFRDRRDLLFRVWGLAGCSIVANMCFAMVFMNGMVWTPVEHLSWGGVEFFFLVSLLLYAWLFLQTSRSVQGLLRFLFNPGDFSKPVLGGSSAKFSKSRNFLFLLLNVFSLVAVLYVGVLKGMVTVRKYWIGDVVLWGENLSALVFPLCAVILFFVLQRILLLFSDIFEERKFTLFVWRSSLYYDWIFSLLALPISAVCLSVEENTVRWLFTGLVCLYIFLQVAKILKVVSAGSSYSRFSVLHIFSYLCALEILPFMCVWQLFYGF